MFSCTDNNKIISASVFIEYKDYAYYLIGANDPDYEIQEQEQLSFLSI